jgi:tetratricopeptide (TPR) repeat protein
VVVLLALSRDSPAETLPDANLRDPDYLASADVGFEQIFDLDYDAARATFSALEARYPNHPGPPLGTAAVVWVQELFERQDFDLNRFIAPGYFNKDSDRKMPTSERQLFFEKIERSLRLSETVLGQDAGSRDARFFLGSAEGLLAAFASTVDGKMLEAVGHAKQAYQYHRELIDEDPDYADAYVGVGVYEYIVDNLRWYLKWPAKMIGYRGSEARGIDYLETARRGETSISDEASAMLMVIYFREKKYHHALALARGLRQRYPKNFLFHLDHGQILDVLGRKREAVLNYLEVVHNAEQGRPNYQRLPLESFRYALGMRLRRIGQEDTALRTFSDCIASVQTPDAQRALCHLEAGLIEDEDGRRERAVAHYESVLALPRVGDSHQTARDRLRTPDRAR